MRFQPFRAAFFAKDVDVFTAIYLLLPMIPQVFARATRRSDRSMSLDRGAISRWPYSTGFNLGRTGYTK
jgi:hypothetical protein